MDWLDHGPAFHRVGDLGKILSVKVRCLLIYAFVAAFNLYGCANTNTSYRYENGYHIVKSGETLYQISWHYGLDYKTVARWNGIRYPYRIYPGQRIVVSADYVPRRKAVTQSAKKPANTRTTTKSSSTAKQSTALVRDIHWQWPVRGKIISTFSPANGGKGIDIVATEGTAIQAASGGRVVYSGSGLRGYGNLIIIKHNESYLSAYAHNRKLLVIEGAQVKAGQKIAELGTSGTDRPKLHFEIRKNGQPVDPLKYLPR
jgi:lipoprotein NlpD